ncbi:MAG: histidine kinase [Planctomycetota bacterium]
MRHWIALFVVSVCCCVGRTDGASVSFPTTAKFRFGDAKQWADPDYDDAHWASVAIPRSWTSEFGPFCSQLRGWYRIDVKLPSQTESRNVSFSIGIISDACEVFVNGRKIAQQGSMLPNLDGMPMDPLVVDVPAEVLSQANRCLIAIRVHRCVYGGGIVGGPLVLGDASTVQRATTPSITDAWFADGVITTVLLVGSIVAMMLAWTSPSSEYRWLAISTTLAAVCQLLQSRVWVATFGYSTARFYADYLGSVWLPVTFHLFVASLLMRSLPRRHLGRIIIVSLLCSGLAFRREWIAISLWTWFLLLLWLNLCWLRWGWSAFRQRQDQAGLIAFGLVSLVVLTLAELLEITGQPTIMRIRWGAIGIAIFFACGVMVLRSRFMRVRQQAHHATAAILNAQEEERRRISRELHDGVTQSLLAFQLNLQMIQANAEDSGAAFEPLIEQVKMTTGELRRLSHDLRPEALERLSLGDAIRSHVAQMQQSTGLRIEAEADEDDDIADSIKDSLYRVYQESLQNVIKHADATTVHVDLRCQRHNVILEVRDDGQGVRIADERKLPQDLGVGVRTIRERARLLGGRAEFIHPQDGGLIVRVTVPRELST